MSCQSNATVGVLHCWGIRLRWELLLLSESAHLRTVVNRAVRIHA